MLPRLVPLTSQLVLLASLLESMALVCLDTGAKIEFEALTLIV